jgi:NAD(P)-dependent dehydrogenase (short-subunit alcohol dehydrogenase family)
MSERQKLAVVTGASRGIGAATAVRLAKDGYHVVLTARSESGLIATDDAIHAAGGTATIAPLDLMNGEDIDRLGAAIGGRWDALDLLMLNAATLGTLSPLAHASPKEFDSVMALNVTAQWRLIRAFDGMLRVGRGTVVAVSSSVARRAEAYWGPYSASKAALDNMIGVYAEEMRALGVKALLVDPGGTRTTMRARAFPGEDPNTLKTPDVVADAIADALPWLSAGCTQLKLTKEGQASISVAA